MLGTERASDPMFVGEWREMHIGGQEGYTELDPVLLKSGIFGPSDFGERYNREGIEGFDKAIATAQRGCPIEFLTPVGGLGQTLLFGTEEKSRGTLLGPIGVEHRDDGTDQVISIVLAQSRKGKEVPVAVCREIGTNSPWTLHPEMNRADVREWNSIAPFSPGDRITTLWPPLKGGTSRYGSRLKLANAA